jgi:hypothetical protein
MDRHAVVEQPSRSSRLHTPRHLYDENGERIWREHETDAVLPQVAEPLRVGDRSLSATTAPGSPLPISASLPNDVPDSLLPKQLERGTESNPYEQVSA